MRVPRHPDTGLFLQSYYEIQWEARNKRKWYAFELTAMATDGRGIPLDHEKAGVFMFHTSERARRYVEGMISRKHPELIRIASNEAMECEKYREKHREETA